MSHRGHAAVVALALALIGVACGSDDTAPDASLAPTDTTSPATPVVTAPPDSSAPSDTAAPTTAAPATDAPTTPAPTTTQPAVPAGWQAIAPQEVEIPLAYPCCASNWYGVPSPALPAAGSPLANGVYAIEWEWAADPRAPITATVNRFEQCSALPEGSCEMADSYMPDELGVTLETAEYPLTLDGNVRVIVGGWVPFDSPETLTGVWMGNGDDLARLVRRLDKDYEAAILEPYRNGVSEQQIVADLTANPAHGFSAPTEEGAGQLAYSRKGGPQLLFQALIPYDADLATLRGSHILGRIALRVEDGPDTVTLYGGFYS